MRKKTFKFDPLKTILNAILLTWLRVGLTIAEETETKKETSNNSELWFIISNLNYSLNWIRNWIGSWNWTERNSFSNFFFTSFNFSILFLYWCYWKWGYKWASPEQRWNLDIWEFFIMFQIGVIEAQGPTQCSLRKNTRKKCLLREATKKCKKTHCANYGEGFSKFWCEPQKSDNF